VTRSPDDPIHPIYLPFTPADLAQHFVADAGRHVAEFTRSADAYDAFLREHPLRDGVAEHRARQACQIEKDERCWTATAVKQVFGAENQGELLAALLTRAFGPRPPLPHLASWNECLAGELRLVFEAAMPAPASYCAWLREHRAERHFIPYALHAGARASALPLEGATRVDALIVNLDNGFALLVEAKVLSDVSLDVVFDAQRNQFARNLDVMLEPGTGHPWLAARRADRSLFALLTPRRFRQHPHSRLYGFLYEEYTRDPSALARDLAHRADCDWQALSRRIGWLTFEDINSGLRGACPWLE
jgi:hypothetical protein